MAPSPKPRWYQFSLRTLVLLLTACCLPLGWLAYERNEVEKRERLILELEEVGGFAEFDESQPFRPAWMQPLLGPHYAGEVVGMNFVGGEATNFEMDHLASLTRLKSITLSGCFITDVGLSPLAELSELQFVALDGSRVTDVGLAHLAGLANLKLLWLSDTGITDAGLAQLQGLNRLESLTLCRTRITDQGLVHLAGLSELQGLDLSGTRVTDKGLSRLADLANLRILNLTGTKITDTGLPSLDGLTKLTEVHLGQTKITDEGYRELKKKLPGTRILHNRERSGFLAMKFSIRDLLFITFLVALAAGWWVDRWRLRAEVKKAEEERFFYFNELTKYRPLPTPLP